MCGSSLIVPSHRVCSSSSLRTYRVPTFHSAAKLFIIHSSNIQLVVTDKQWPPQILRSFVRMVIFNQTIPLNRMSHTTCHCIRARHMIGGSFFARVSTLMYVHNLVFTSLHCIFGSCILVCVFLKSSPIRLKVTTVCGIAFL